MEADIRKQWKDANVWPLWESPTAHKPPGQGQASHRWPWTEMRKLLLDATKIQNPAAVERRVLSLINPSNQLAEDESTVPTISAALQILLPGETARPHRHSMNALRFVLEGSGAYTIVDGKRCLMEEGDLILTPGWCWHQHEHCGKAPIIWLDVLDVPFHNQMGTSEFEPGPVHDVPVTIDDNVFDHSSFIPDALNPQSSYSPRFRYSRIAAIEALKAAPIRQDGLRVLRYVNPLTGGPVMPFLDCMLIEINSGRSSRPTRTNASAVAVVIDGMGATGVGNQKVEWKKGDVFTCPRGQWTWHSSNTSTSKLFVTSDRDIFKRLGILKEEIAS